MLALSLPSDASSSLPTVSSDLREGLFGAIRKGILLDKDERSKRGNFLCYFSSYSLNPDEHNGMRFQCL